LIFKKREMGSIPAHPNRYSFTKVANPFVSLRNNLFWGQEDKL